MEILATDRIDIIAQYDLTRKRVEGKVYSKIEGKEKVKVAYVIENPQGTSKLYVLAEYRDRDYIVEDYEKLKEQFVNYANMWSARAGRGIY